MQRKDWKDSRTYTLNRAGKGKAINMYIHTGPMKIPPIIVNNDMN